MSHLQRKSLMARHKNKLQEGRQRTFGHSLLSNSSVIPEKKNFEYFPPLGSMLNFALQRQTCLISNPHKR